MVDDLIKEAFRNPVGISSGEISIDNGKTWTPCDPFKAHSISRFEFEEEIKRTLTFYKQKIKFGVLFNKNKTHESLKRKIKSIRHGKN